MEWDQKGIDELSRLLRRRHRQMQEEHKTDRRNLSAIWNRYLGVYGASLLGVGRKDLKDNAPNMALFVNLVNIVNHNNDLIADSLILDNPDRIGQYIIMKRDMAEKILILGLV